MTRYEFLRAVAAIPGAWLGQTLLNGGFAYDRAALGAFAQPAAAVLARVSTIIQEYDSQGIHRTATDTDNESATWLTERAKSAGADAHLDRFAISRVDVHRTWIDVGGRRASGLPLFDGTFTDGAGLRGRLVAAGADGNLGLLSADGGAIASEGRALAELRRSGRYEALVVVTRGASPGLSPMNAIDFATPYGCPVLQVGSDDGGWLEERARAGAEAQLLAHATRTGTHAFNVVASVAGTQPALPPVVVITPRSGWWQCASERGGGIACWLEAILRAKEARPARTVQFAASSGHELGHLGLDAFLDAQPGLVKGAAAWVHLGANIGAASGQPRLQASSDELELAAAAALEPAGAPVQQRAPRGRMPSGEARNLHAGGARYVSLLGSSPVFHNPSDRWPTAVDADAVARFASAVGELVVTLASA
jgi:hypothetical protein